MGPKGRWSRRQFMSATADATVLATLAGALKPLTALAADGGPTLTLYDPRFAAARPLALALAGPQSLCATGGDPTELVLEFADGKFGRTPARLQGVTTESVPFCLQQLIPGARLIQRRADRDLFVWTLEGRT